MKIIDQGTVCSFPQGSKNQSNAFAKISVTSTGRWICGFRSASSKQGCAGQQAALSYSDDQGQSWTGPIMPFVPEPVNGKPGNFRCAMVTEINPSELLAVVAWVDQSDPTLPFFNEETEGLLDMYIFFSRSYDDGETWSKPEIMDTTPYNMPTPTTGPVLVMPNGKLACQFELNKHYYEEKPWVHHSVLMFSSDNGKTWPEYSQANDDSNNMTIYWDQRPNVVSPERVLNLFWTYDKTTESYLNIHASESLDSGHTWSPMWDTQVPGQPAPPISLPDGTIAMVYIDRTDIPTIKMRISPDGGHTWPAETELEIYRHDGKSQTVANLDMTEAWAEMGAFSVGLPETAALPNGDILVSYYAGPTTDCTAVKWARIGPTTSS